MERVPPKILLVEDDFELADIMKDQFELFGCEVDLAQNGIEAIDRLKEKNYTCIISDIRMPKMDGISMLSKIREMGIDTPTVIMTGFSNYTEKEVISTGAAVLLEKPFTTDKLKELVEMYIELLPYAKDKY